MKETLVSAVPLNLLKKFSHLKSLKAGNYPSKEMRSAILHALLPPSKALYKESVAYSFSYHGGITLSNKKRTIISPSLIVRD